MINIRSEIFHYKKFKLHLVEGYVQKIPIIEYPCKIMIMDSGCRPDYRVVLEYVKKVMKRKLKDIKLVIASHVHPDHAGGISFLAKNLNAHTAAPAGINLWYKGLRGFLQHKMDLCLTHYVAYASNKPFKRLYFPRYIKTDYSLSHNEKIPFFEDWIVYYCPGHTTHDIVFYNSCENILYAADLILKLKNRLFLPIPVNFPCLMKESIVFIDKICADDIFMAHGGMVSGSELKKSVPMLERQADFLYEGKKRVLLMNKFTGFSDEMKKYNQLCGKS
ncbi:MAG: hypothetical protein CSA18_03490 [Deltaproteobacteria bacterium]|nr:MAG: hypothetical protein CSA18_03490 [Deltaproteobacteria bacterium]